MPSAKLAVPSFQAAAPPTPVARSPTISEADESLGSPHSRPFAMTFSTPGLGVNRHISDNGFSLYPHSLSQQSTSADHVRSPPPTPESESGSADDHGQVDIDLVESPWLSGRATTPNPAMSSSADATSKSGSGKGGGGKSKSFTASVKKLFSSSSDRERDKERQRLRQLSISSPTLVHSTSLAVQPPPNPVSRSTSRSSSTTAASRSRTRSQSPHGSVVSAAYPSPTSSASSSGDSPVAEASPFALPPEGVPPVPTVDPTLRARAQSLPAPQRLPPELMAAAAIADADQFYMTATLPDPSDLGMSWQSQSSLSTALGNASVVSLPNLPSSTAARSMQSPMVPPKSLATRRRRDSAMILTSKQTEEQEDWLPPTGVTKKMSLTPKVVADSSSSSSIISSSSASSKSLPPPPPLAPPRIPIWAQFQNQSSAPPGPLSPVSQAAFLSSIDEYRSTPVASSYSSSAISSPASSTRGLVSPAAPDVPITHSPTPPQLPLKSPALSTQSFDSPAPQPNDLLTKAPVPPTDPQDLLRLESLITATVDSERRVLQHLRKQSLSGASSPSAPTPVDLTPAVTASPAAESDLDRRLAKMAEFERLISTDSPALSSRSLASPAPPTPTLSAVSMTQFPGASAEGDHMVALAALHRVQMDKYPVPACELSSESSDLDLFSSDEDEVDDEVQQRVIARHPSLANIFAPLMGSAQASSSEPLRDPRQAAEEAAQAARQAEKSRGVKGWFAGNRTRILGTLKTVLRDASGSGNAAARSADAGAGNVSADAKQELVQFAKHVIRSTSESTLSEPGAAKKRQSVKRRTVTTAQVSDPIVEEGDEMDVINMYARSEERDWVRRRSSAKGKAREARGQVESVVEADDELVELVRQIEALMRAEDAGRQE